MPSQHRSVCAQTAKPQSEMNNKEFHAECTRFRMHCTRISKKAGPGRKQETKVRELVAREIKFAKALKKKGEEGGWGRGGTTARQRIRLVGRSGRINIYIAER
jgi:hypothetical protein